VYAAVVLLFMWLPILGVALASFNQSRFFSFPFDSWSLEWYREATSSTTVQELFTTSFRIAIAVAVIAALIGFAGGMAFARYRWAGRAIFQKLIILPILLPGLVLGLSIRLWLDYLDMLPTWQTAVLAHTIWIVPITTLIIAISVYNIDPELEAAAQDLGAGRARAFLEITVPPLVPAVRTAAIFAFLLSWLNFPLSYFTTGSESTVPEWIFAKQVGGYTPLLPSVGILAIVLPVLAITAAIIVLQAVRLTSRTLLGR
jgi:spermidine/putrescine transport system permease protein